MPYWVVLTLATGASDRSRKVVEVGGLNNRARRSEITKRVEALGAVRLEGGAVESVGAGFGGGEDGTAAALSVLGGERRDEDLKLFGGVGCGDEAVGAVNAHVAGQTIDDDGISAGSATAEGEVVDVGVVLARAVAGDS